MSVRPKLAHIAFVCLALFHGPPARADVQVLDARLHHLRAVAPREWSEFPETPETGHFELHFESSRNETEQTLRLRQQDVKQ
ncbi:MAG TPA: hypothetical protein VLA12_09880, partial [Planctomycetaceae bacterium]|nr:hypothetical protein [Planctomycetaceae bacterium]